MTTTKQFDYLNRLTQISSAPSANYTLPLTFNYNYNPANQQTKNTLADGSYWMYGYDSLGQVTNACKYFSDGTPVAGQQFDYTFDTIGNRLQTLAGGDATGANLRLANYTVNNLNQITSRDVPGTNDVIGASILTNAITVNGLTAYRKQEYFWQPVKINNGSAAVWTNIIVAGGQNVTGNVYVAKEPEAFLYDADGNLTNDGRWAYIWDGENRLVGMATNTLAGPAYQLSFGYDPQGRRIQKVSMTNGVTIGTYTYLYDGWNLVTELKNGALVRSYMWGNDLSGTLQGAGGVGGLLEVSFTGTAGTNSFPAFDGNGNVAALINATNGTIVANYEYSAFGEPIRITGVMAKNNPFRFSTKFDDDESDLIYYGYRYYKPSTGTWPNRDPYQERGGKNLYEFVLDNPVNNSDALGLSCTEAVGHSGQPLMAFTDPSGGWSGGTAVLGDKAGSNPFTYGEVTVKYTANVSVVCQCAWGTEIRNGVRVVKKSAQGSWPVWDIGTVGIGIDVPVATAIESGLAKLGAKWIKGVIGTGAMAQTDADEIASLVSKMPQPTNPSDGDWKGGKSPCSK